MARETAQITSLDREHCSALWRNVLINVWGGDTTEHAARGVERDIVTLLERGARPAILGVSREGVRMVPDAPVRTLLSAMLRRHGHALVAISSAVLGDGFYAATKRTVMATIALVARQPCPLRIFDGRDDATSWLAGRLGDPAIATVDLGAALAEVEGAYDRHRAENP